MQNELFLEVRKLEVRLQEFMKAEDKAFKALTTFIEKVKELTPFMEAPFTKRTNENLEKILEMRLETFKALQDALTCMAKAEHEKSHLSESYGSIVLALEQKLQNIIGKAR